MPLVSVPTLKTFFGIATSVTTYDAMFGLLAGYVDKSIKQYCKQGLESTTYPGAVPNDKGDSGYYNGNNQRLLVIRQLPITAVTSIYLDTTGRFGDNPDGAFAASTLLVVGTDYVVDWDGCLPGTSTRCSYSGRIWRLNNVWPAVRQYTPGTIGGLAAENPGSIKIAYTAGYPTVPVDLEAAACELVGWMRRNGPKGGTGIASEGLGAYHYSMASAALNSAPELGSVRQLLAAYREVRLY